MTARAFRPIGLRADGSEGEATCRPLGPDALAAVIRAAHATTRTEAIRHLMDAVSVGLHAPDAMKALAAWDQANPVRRCTCGRPVPASSLDGTHCAEHDSEMTA